jgi:2-polyprenyl-3-methyl-5-hydroxy-6-metoxy-1,4-benzoquinol methylase
MNLLKYLRLFKTWLNLRHQIAHRDMFFHELGDMNKEPVQREDLLIELSRNKRVLHFGFTDAPFTKTSLDGGSMLHCRIKEAAASLYGVDVDSAAVEIYRQATGDTCNAILDIEAEPDITGKLRNNYDLLLFGEILEHLKNPGNGLAHLHTICAANPSGKLVVTVPNAFSVLFFAAAANGHEIVHPDHYYWFSPVTLKKLLVTYGFREIEIRIGVSNNSMIPTPGITGTSVIAICTA